ncbi:MAG TPA: nuclear transport factor 2 family protein [Kofleriaceae bacterium]|nr:nuclear transport factor 2 family protein [Kofleriaceae bacterium]
MSTKETVLAYLHAIESHNLDLVAQFLHDDVQVTEHPNKLNPAGKTYDKAALREAGERGKALLASERYEVRAMTVEGDHCVAQILWTGVLADGREMKAHICSAIELRDGRVFRQEQYDCFI